jgi:flagellar protein FlaG
MSEISAIAQTATGPQGPARTPVAAAVPVRDRQGFAAPGKALAAEPTASTSAGAPAGAAAAEAVAQLNGFLRHERLSLEFSVDQASGRVVIRITDTDTDQLIRQIPPEEVMTIARHLSEGPEAGALRGLLVSESV